MTNQGVREQIAHEVFKSNRATLIYDCEGKLTDYAKPTFVADRIIEIVREAAIEEMCAEYGDDGEGIKVRLNRALDMAFGADIEGDYWSAIADEAEREYRQMEEDDNGVETTE